MSNRARLLLRAFAVWTVWVWGTRIWNIVGDDTRSTGFKVVHAVLAAVSIAFAVATWSIARRTRPDTDRSSRRDAATSSS